MSILINILLAINVLVSLLIIFIVLMQRPKSEGLGAAFGGGMTENIFGAGTTNALATITRYLGGLFFLLSIALSWLYIKESSRKSNVQQRLMAPSKASAPVATPAQDGKGTPAAVTKPSAPGATPAPAAATKPTAPVTTPAPAAATKPVAPGATPAPAPTAPAAAPAPATTPAPRAPEAPAKTETPAPTAASPAAPATPATPAPAKPAQDAKPADKPN